MFVWGVHYCVQLLPEVIFLNIPFAFSFAIRIPFYFSFAKAFFLSII